MFGARRSLSSSVARAAHPKRSASIAALSSVTSAIVTRVRSARLPAISKDRRRLSSETTRTPGRALATSARNCARS